MARAVQAHLRNQHQIPQLMVGCRAVGAGYWQTWLPGYTGSDELLALLRPAIQEHHFNHVCIMTPGRMRFMGGAPADRRAPNSLIVYCLTRGNQEFDVRLWKLDANSGGRVYSFSEIAGASAGFKVGSAITPDRLFGSVRS